MYRVFQPADKNLNGYPIYWHNCVNTLIVKIHIDFGDYAMIKKKAQSPGDCAFND
jgi:hypothetical protein